MTLKNLRNKFADEKWRHFVAVTYHDNPNEYLFWTSASFAKKLWSILQGFDEWKGKDNSLGTLLNTSLGRNRFLGKGDHVAKAKPSAAGPPPDPDAPHAASAAGSSMPTGAIGAKKRVLPAWLKVDKKDNETGQGRR